MMDFEFIEKQLKKKLKKERFRHTQGVMYTAASLAMCHGEDVKKAMLAGLLHDCGKYPTLDKQLKMCKKYKLELSKTELEVPALIHSKLGACLAKEKYGVEDQEIIHAILYHTTGKPEMTMLEKIIYLADYIEPNRRMIPGLSEIRELAYQDIDRAVCVCSQNTLEYLQKNNRAVDPMTQETYEYYKA